MKLDPHSTSAYSNRGIIFARQSKYDLALADFNRIIEIDPNNAENYGNRGILYRHLGKNDLAIADFRKAKQLFIDRGDDDSVKNVTNLLQSISEDF